MNIRNSCDVLVFSDEKQHTDCAKTVRYKMYSGFTPALIGFSVTLMITIMIAGTFFADTPITDTKVAKPTTKINQNGAALIFIGTALVTLSAFYWGYTSANGSDLKVLFDYDQAELARRKSTYPSISENDNINGLISERDILSNVCPNFDKFLFLIITFWMNIHFLPLARFD